MDFVDLLVIGGGITGAGVARDAALRGIKTLLVDQGDFSSGTSSANTRLVHGGLRYLEHLELGLVMESLRERNLILRMLPHLVRPLPILLPSYRGDKHHPLVIRMGLKVYQFLGKGLLPGPQWFSPEEALRLAPSLRGEGLRGAGLYYDLQVTLPERLVLEILISARETGAKLENHTKVVDIRWEEGTYKVELRGLQGTRFLRAKVIANCTGPWLDRVRHLAGLNGTELYPTKGTHLVVPGGMDRGFYTEKEDRMVFVLPLGHHTLVGTTDTPFTQDPSTVRPASEELDYLLEAYRRLFPQGSLPESPLFAYAGVRPLVYQEGKSPSQMSRKDRVFSEGPQGCFLSVGGGKLTTFRAMAKRVVDQVASVLGVQTPCTTDRTPFGGYWEALDPVSLGEQARSLAREYGLEPAQAEHLLSLYGRRTLKLMELCREDPSLTQPVHPSSPDLAVQVVHAFQEEEAKDLEDLILQRLYLSITPGRGIQALENIVELVTRLGIMEGEEAREQARAIGKSWEERFLVKRNPTIT
jgi:glycerol-3-phosphate dehydrogenase